MRWEKSDRENIEDRRGEGGGGGGGFGGGAKLGLGGVLILGVLSLVFGKDFFAMVGGGDGTTTTTAPGGQAPTASSPDEPMVDFVNAVLKDAQAFWRGKLGEKYQTAVVVLFSDATRSGCGYAESAMGPFYCPTDEKVYIDLAFYRELRTRFGAPGDFAQAYVIAHELGHHIQNLLGIERRLRQEQASRPGEQNELSVMMELQADCFAGIWASSAQSRGELEAGDFDEAIGAAAAVGDDRLQKQATGRVNPETWTHGSSAQRMAWFKKGFDGKSVDGCDTFGAARRLR
jgi:predicted metalloprotease